MADNVTIAQGVSVRTHDVGGNHIQFTKTADGAAGSETTQRVLTGTPSSSDGGAVVRQTPNLLWNADFSAVNAAALVSPQMTKRYLGAGFGVAQSGGNLVVTTGTTANSEFLARSTRAFKGSLRQIHRALFSQRITNQNFIVMLADLVGEGLACTINSATSISVTKPAHGLTAANIGQSMMVGAVNGANGAPGRYAIASVPDANTIKFTVSGWPASGSCTVDLFGWNYLQTSYLPNNQQQANTDSQRNGWNSGVVLGAIAPSTTSSSGYLQTLAFDARQAYWAHSGGLSNSGTPNITTFAHRYEFLPEDNVELYLYLWAYNGTTAPASSTTWTTSSLSVEETPNVSTYIAGFRPQGANAPLPVNPTSALPAGTAAIGDVGLQYRANATGAASAVNIPSPATPGLHTIKASAGRLLQFVATNTGSSTVYYKFFNGSATLGITVAAFEIALPPNVPVVITSEGGIGFSSAIQGAITGAKGLTDTTAITANTVTGFIATV